jgi:hypothetical protein
METARVRRATTVSPFLISFRRFTVLSQNLSNSAVEHDQLFSHFPPEFLQDCDKKWHTGHRKTVWTIISCGRGVAIFAEAFMGIPAQQAAKITRPLMPSAAPAVLLHSLHTQQGVCNIVIAMTRRDFVKPAFSLRYAP